MTSATLLDWIQVEDATQGLTGAEMPDGRAILVWPNGGDAHFAVIASPSAWLANDIVEAGDVDTIVTDDVNRTAVFNIDGEIYVTVNTWQGSGGEWTLKIYQADDPTDPYAGWTLASTVDTAFSPGAIFGYSGWGAGIPLKLDSGRWVLCQGGGETGADPGWAASGTFAHSWYSDSGAAGPWIHTLEYGHYLFGFPRTQWVSAQVVADPDASGDLYFTSGASSTNEGLLWRSQDDGASWTSYNSLWSAWNRFSPIIDNGVAVFSMSLEDLFSPGSDVTDLVSGWDQVEGWTAPGMSTDEETRRAIIAIESVFYFVSDQVARGGGIGTPSWHFNVHWMTTT